MGALLDNLAYIRDKLDSAILLLAHPDKRGDGIRGHSSLQGAADLIIALRTGAGGIRTATVQKVREGEAGEQFRFRLDQVALPNGRDHLRCSPRRRIHGTESVSAAPSCRHQPP